MVNHGLPCLNDVLLVEGFTTNLISISHICDQAFNVNFSKYEFIITNKDRVVLTKELRSKDICYMWISQPRTCLLSKVDQTKLWHQILGHLNLKSMKKVISVKAIRGLKI